MGFSPCVFSHFLIVWMRPVFGHWLSATVNLKLMGAVLIFRPIYQVLISVPTPYCLWSASAGALTLEEVCLGVPSCSCCSLQCFVWRTHFLQCPSLIKACIDMNWHLCRSKLPQRFPSDSVQKRTRSFGGISVGTCISHVAKETPHQACHPLFQHVLVENASTPSRL